MNTNTGTRPDRLYPWFVLSVTSLGVLLVLLNVGSLNVGLPVISQHFHAGAVTANWILLSYMLVSTILILVFGQFADIFGRKKLYLIGFAIFTAVSLLLGFAPNVWVLILLRAIQAAGGALIITNTTALITDAFPERMLGTGLSINVLVASIAQLIGPVVGGFFVSALGWQWVFWFNVPFGVLGLLWGLFTLRSNITKRSSEKVDALGSLIVFLALGGLIVALSEGGTLGWGNWLVLLGFACFLLLTPLFFWLEKRAVSPMIDFTLFHNRPYAMANVATFLNMFAQSAIVLLIALYYQVVGKESAFAAGLKVLPVTIGMLVASPIAGALTRKYTARLLSSAGLAIASCGLLILLLTLGPGSAYWVTGLGQLLAGAGAGLFATPNTASIMLAVPANRRGIANGLRSMLNNMGQVLSTAVSLTILTSALPMRLKDVFYTGISVPLANSDLQQIVTGYRWAFFVLFVATVLGIIASLLRGGQAAKELKKLQTK